ncbi:MAG: hypothetical protein TQ35_0010050 [Candidatus Aramenus sulfurataquae]|uniref:Uncharacterized protein n=1 Tax=Candidatus Aramenus sulfurataquae TaxID=1326980 RepID=A0ACC6TRX9_9CREN
MEFYKVVVKPLSAYFISSISFMEFYMEDSWEKTTFPFMEFIL